MIYRRIFRPVLFIFSPETIHYIVVFLIKYFLRIPGVRRLVLNLFNVEEKSLERNVFGIKFKNPVGLAAGFDKNGEFYKEMAVFGFSFIEIGTVTPLGQPGNPRPRSFRLPEDRALINRMGLNNHGVVRIAKNIAGNKPEIIIGGNIGKNTVAPDDYAIDDYITCFKVLHELVDYFVVNVSCPNIGDIKKLQDADTVLEILVRLKELSVKMHVAKPILLKISPDLNDQQLDEMVEIAFRAGIDGFVATNTTVSRENLVTPKEKIIAKGEGGLSGKPLRDRSTRVIRYLVEKSGGKLPVIGVGGIIDPADAIEKLKAGASLVQIYTGFIYEGPFLVKRINKMLLSNKEV